jgi:hypothetical protein
MPAQLALTAFMLSTLGGSYPGGLAAFRQPSRQVLLHELVPSAGRSLEDQRTQFPRADT